MCVSMGLGRCTTRGAPARATAHYAAGPSIYIFLQRLIYSFSRFPPPLTVLREASAHVLAEAELEYTWSMALFEGDPDDPELGQLADEFGTFMSAENRRQVLAQRSEARCGAGRGRRSNDAETSARKPARESRRSCTSARTNQAAQCCFSRIPAVSPRRPACAAGGSPARRPLPHPATAAARRIGRAASRRSACGAQRQATRAPARWGEALPRKVLRDCRIAWKAALARQPPNEPR
jgi:hypothetical protein